MATGSPWPCSGAWGRQCSCTSAGMPHAQADRYATGQANVDACMRTLQNSGAPAVPANTMKYLNPSGGAGVAGARISRPRGIFGCTAPPACLPRRWNTTRNSERATQSATLRMSARARGTGMVGSACVRGRGARRALERHEMTGVKKRGAAPGRPALWHASREDARATGSLARTVPHMRWRSHYAGRNGPKRGHNRSKEQRAG